MLNIWICKNLILGLLKIVLKEMYLFVKECMCIIEMVIIFYVKKNWKDVVFCIYVLVFNIV